MADFSALIAQIEAYVKQNGNNEITGNGLQSILVGMVNAIGGALNDAVADLQGNDTTLTNSIGSEADARVAADNAIGVLIAAINEKIPSEASSGNKLADKAFVTTLTTALQGAVDAINEKIPSEASSGNKLADKAFVTTLTTALQGAVDAINANIGNGYVYAGVATPSGTPVSGKVVYLTAQAGTYTNYGGLVVPTGISVLKYNGTTWSQEQVMSMADIYRNPLMGLFDCSTAGATAAKVVTADGYVLPTNGGSMKVRMANHTTVDNVTLNINGTGAKTLYYKGKAAGINNTWGDGAILNVMYDSTNSIYLAYDANAGTGDGVFDISDYTGDTYEDLVAALADVPVSERHGGMIVRFIQGSAPSSDNKYRQFRFTEQDWSANPSNWEKEVGLFKQYTDNPALNEYIRELYIVNNSGKSIKFAKWNSSNPDIYYIGIIVESPLEVLIQIQRNYSDNTTKYFSTSGGNVELQMIVSPMPDTIPNLTAGTPLGVAYSKDASPYIKARAELISTVEPIIADVSELKDEVEVLQGVAVNYEYTDSDILNKYIRELYLVNNSGKEIAFAYWWGSDPDTYYIGIVDKSNDAPLVQIQRNKSDKTTKYYSASDGGVTLQIVASPIPDSDSVPFLTKGNPNDLAYSIEASPYIAARYQITSAVNTVIEDVAGLSENVDDIQKVLTNYEYTDSTTLNKYIKELYVENNSGKDIAFAYWWGSDQTLYFIGIIDKSNNNPLVQITRNKSDNETKYFSASGGGVNVQVVISPIPDSDSVPFLTKGTPNDLAYSREASPYIAARYQLGLSITPIQEIVGNYKYTDSDALNKYIRELYVVNNSGKELELAYWLGGADEYIGLLEKDTVNVLVQIQMSAIHGNYTKASGNGVELHLICASITREAIPHLTRGNLLGTSGKRTYNPYINHVLSVDEESKKKLAEYAVPSKIYLFKNTDNYIFKNPLQKYLSEHSVVRFGCSSIVYQFKDECKINPSADVTMQTALYDCETQNTPMLDHKDVSIITSTKEVGDNENVIQIIGDSWTEMDFYKNALFDLGYVPNIKAIGTRKSTNVPNEYNEGRSGGTLAYLFTNNTLTAESRFGVNPFMQPEGQHRSFGNKAVWDAMIAGAHSAKAIDTYNALFDSNGYPKYPQNGDIFYDGGWKEYDGSSWNTSGSTYTFEFDYTKYFSVYSPILGSDAPDFLFLEFCLNDVNGARDYSIQNYGKIDLGAVDSVINQNIERIYTILESYKSLNGNGKLGICLLGAIIGNENNNFDNSGRELFSYANCPRLVNPYYWRYRQRMIQEFDGKESQGVYLIDVGMMIDTENNTAFTEQSACPVNGSTAKIKVYGNVAHPALAWKNSAMQMAAFIQKYRI